VGTDEACAPGHEYQVGFLLRPPKKRTGYRRFAPVRPTSVQMQVAATIFDTAEFLSTPIHRAAILTVFPEGPVDLIGKQRADILSYGARGSEFAMLASSSR
jgi:hypothetical protein